MSEEEREEMQDVNDSGRVTIQREFQAELTEGDGRTIEMRVVPYNKVARVTDPPELGGTGIPYDEMWLPSAFDRQLSAANRVSVFLNVEHEPGFRGVIGRGTELRSEPDALYGSFRVFDNDDGNKALELVREEVLKGVSIEAVPFSSRKRGGVVERVRAHLDAVALARFRGWKNPAYQGAEVLAVREAEEEREIVESLTEPIGREDIVERLSAVGYEPLVHRAVVSKSWDGSPSRYSDEEYERACLLCRTGDAPPKTRCSLPVLEPNGDLNVNALGAAAARLNQVSASVDQKAAAARKLIRYYRQADMAPPERVRQLAAR